MPYTVSDFINSHASSVRLLAGQGGLARAIGEVGILDYELVPGLKSRYQRTNFYEGQLVLSTFLYARDNPFLIIDAVKYLVSVGASALVIKNVFHLEIPDAALRFANARNLPVLLATSDSLYFDEVILDVGTRIRELESAIFVQREIDALLAERDDETAVIAHARRLNPSFADELAAIYVLGDDALDANDAIACQGQLVGTHGLLSLFDGGMLLILSEDLLSENDVAVAVDSLEARLHARDIDAHVGASEVHQGTGTLATVVLEAIHAARIAHRNGSGTVWHKDLGTLRAVLPHASSPSMASFAHQVIDPIRDFDTEHNALLERTVTSLIEHDWVLTDTARALETHPNTVRYRMGQIKKVTGLDWRRPRDLEQLSLAHAIEVAREVGWR